MNVSRILWNTKLTQELQIFNGKSEYRKTIGPGSKTSESQHYSKEQLLSIRKVMCEVRKFKTMPPETIRRICKYRLNKGGRDQVRKPNVIKNQLIMAI